MTTLPPSEKQATDGVTPKTKKRIAIALSLIVAALAVIPLMNMLKSKPQITDASSGKISGTLLPAQTIAPEAPVTDIDTSAPAAESTRPASPDLAATPGMSALPKLMVEANVPPPHPPKPASPMPIQAAAPLRESTAALQHKAALPSDQPKLRAAEQAAPVTPPAPARPQGSSFGYNVQLGLFSSPDNAEKLMDELKKRGINARSETKVQLGPFKSRAEAEEAMAELRKLGYIPLLVPLGQ